MLSKQGRSWWILPPEGTVFVNRCGLLDKMLTFRRWRTSLCLRWAFFVIALYGHLLTAHFYRGFLRVLRGLTDGSSDGRVPRAEDLCRVRFDAVVYIDKNGVISPIGRLGRSSFRASAEFTDPQGRTTVPPTKQGVERLNTEPNVISGTGPTRGNGFSPIDFLANSTSFSFVTPISSLARGGPSSQPPKLDGNDMSLPPMELMMYDNLMTDIRRTTRFFDQEFRSSALFGSTPAPPVTMEDVRSVRGREFQAPSTMYR